MKSILFAAFVVVSFVACNGPEQNSTVGNSQDSTTMDRPAMSDSLTSSGPGPDNSGSHPGPGTLTDTALHGNGDSLIQTSASRRDFKRKSKDSTMNDKLKSEKTRQQ
jgi:hypothetical protein